MENLDFIITYAARHWRYSTYIFTGNGLDGVIIISTPQEIALQDVKRGIRMLDKLGTKIIGLIDNMSHFIGDDGKYNIFVVAVEKTAKEFEKEFLEIYQLIQK